MMPYLYADPSVCTGCRICELVCSLYNEKVISPNKSRIRVVRIEPSIDTPISCRNCAKAPCAEICPTSAIYRDERGVIMVNENQCIGCSACVMACPFGAITIHPEKGVAIKCTLCGMCVDFCPVRCLKIIDSEKLSMEKRYKFAEQMEAKSK